jgi:hypothetical protein
MENSCALPFSTILLLYIVVYSIGGGEMHNILKPFFVLSLCNFGVTPVFETTLYVLKKAFQCE